MSEQQPPPPPTPPDPDPELLEPLEVNISVPQPARLHNYLVGGDDNFAADRELADFLSSTSPVAIDTARASVRALGAFMVRTVRYLTGEAGIRQFLSGTATIPTKNNIHDVAQEIAPDSRVVYVGRDPVVLAYAHSLREGTAEGGATAFIHGSMRRDPTNVLKQAAETLDFTKPVALVLLETLSFIREEDDPYGIVAQLIDAVPSGSYLVVSHTTNDVYTEEMNEIAKRFNETMNWPYVLRSYAQISRFFDRLELVDAGLVQIDQWRRHENKPIPCAEALIPIYGGVGRKP